jgi:hypothetical protein
MLYPWSLESAVRFGFSPAEKILFGGVFLLCFLAVYWLLQRVFPRFKTPLYSWVTAGAGLVFLCALSYDIVASPHTGLSSIFLTSTFAMLREGYLYTMPGQGPQLISIYGPLAFLAYWPVIWCAHPVPAIALGIALSAAYVLAPLVCLFSGSCPEKRVSRAIGISVGVLVGFALITSQVFGKVIFVSWADAPALALGAAACIVLVNRGASGVLAAGVLTAAALCTKQTMIFFAAGMAGYVWRTYGRQYGVRFAGAAALCIAAVFGVLAWGSGLPAIFFHLFAIPSMHGSKWSGAWISLLYPAAEFFLSGGWLVAAVLPGVRVRRAQPFIWAAVCLLPAAILGYAKRGGTHNSFGFPLYFALLAAGILLEGMLCARWSDPGAKGRLLRWMVILLLLAGISIHAKSLYRLYRIYRVPPEYADQRAFEYCRVHPGKVYFLTAPLGQYLAEGRMYHTLGGLVNLDLASINLSFAERQEYLPAAFRKIAFMPEVMDCQVEPFLELFPEFSRREPVAELPRFEVYVASP